MLSALKLCDIVKSFLFNIFCISQSVSHSPLVHSNSIGPLVHCYLSLVHFTHWSFGVRPLTRWWWSVELLIRFIDHQIISKYNCMRLFSWFCSVLVFTFQKPAFSMSSQVVNQTSEALHPEGLTWLCEFVGPWLTEWLLTCDFLVTDHWSLITGHWLIIMNRQWCIDLSCMLPGTQCGQELICAQMVPVYEHLWESAGFAECPISFKGISQNSLRRIAGQGPGLWLYSTDCQTLPPLGAYWELGAIRPLFVVSVAVAGAVVVVLVVVVVVACCCCCCCCCCEPCIASLTPWPGNSFNQSCVGALMAFTFWHLRQMEEWVRFWC